MSRKTKFTPEEKEQAVIDYLEGNKSSMPMRISISINLRLIDKNKVLFQCL